MSHLDKKYIFTCIRNFFEYFELLKNNHESDLFYLKQIILFCQEQNYPALEIFILGSSLAHRYPELRLLTGWSNQEMSYMNDLCLDWMFEGFRPVDPIINEFFDNLNTKVKADRKKDKW